MPGTAKWDDLNESLDLLAEPSLFKLYTQICFCFSMPDASSYPALIGPLSNGLERLSVSFPWLTGQVVTTNPGDGSPDIFKIKPLHQVPELVVMDYRQQPFVPTMDDLRRAKFPFNMLDESVVAPRKTIPGGSEQSATETAPVFLLQVTLIAGGLLLTFLGQHNTMDMTGQGQIMRLLSKACRNEPFTSEELSVGNLARSNLIPLLDESYQQGPELAYQIVQSHPVSDDINSPPPQPSPPECTWAYFTFPSASLTSLKSIATETITVPLDYISTDDALSAFIWQSTIRARLPRLNPTAESTLARAVDVRRYLNVPQTYPGVMQNMTYHTYTLQKLVKEPLGAVASHLRSAVDPKTSNLAFNTRALATVLDRAPDKSTVSITATLDLSVDIMLSSWSKVDCCDLDFNLGLGEPEAVRRPRFEPVESLIYLMPRARDGEIAVAICLRNEDMERLRADEEFTRYGKYFG